MLLLIVKLILFVYKYYTIPMEVLRSLRSRSGLDSALGVIVLSLSCLWMDGYYYIPQLL